MLLQVTGCAERSGRSQAIGIVQIRSIRNCEELGAGLQGAPHGLGAHDLKCETSGKGGRDGGGEQGNSRFGHRVAVNEG